MTEFWDAFLKVLGPLAGFATAYFFNIFSTRRREQKRWRVLQQMHASMLEEVPDATRGNIAQLQQLIDLTGEALRTLKAGLAASANERGEFTWLGRTFTLMDTVPADLLELKYRYTLTYHKPLFAEMMKVIDSNAGAELQNYGLFEELVADRDRAYARCSADVEKLSQALHDLLGRGLSFAELDRPQNLQPLIFTLGKTRASAIFLQQLSQVVLDAAEVFLAAPAHPGPANKA